MMGRIWLVAGLLFAAFAPADLSAGANTARLDHFIEGFERPSNKSRLTRWVRNTGPWARFVRQPFRDTLTTDERNEQIRAERAGRCDRVVELEATGFTRRWPHMAPIFAPSFPRGDIAKSFLEDFLVEMSASYRRCLAWAELPALIAMFQANPPQSKIEPIYTGPRLRNDTNSIVTDFPLARMYFHFGQLSFLAFCGKSLDSARDLWSLYTDYDLFNFRIPELYYLLSVNHLDNRFDDQMSVSARDNITLAAVEQYPRLARGHMPRWSATCSIRNRNVY